MYIFLTLFEKGIAINNHIVIEGPLGVGKSSFVKKLAQHMNGQELLEHTEDNPYLTRFYKNPKHYRFQIQMFFLIRRYQHSLELDKLDPLKRPVFTDFMFDKDRIYAKANLDESEYYLYDQMFQILKKKIKPPDLVVFLQAKTEVLVERIKKRNRDYEKSINVKYLDKVNRLFNDYFFHYTDSPLLVINASEIDFVNVKEDFEDLVNEINRIKSGVQYYVPASSRK
ncbi:MAG: deoxynucleoside kinase [Deltaproteobacteria bacterium]|nr:deoxynucleoside kinase [Deltaproteobacteria bacterium]